MHYGSVKYMDYQIKFSIPFHLRDELKKPIGRLLSGHEFLQTIHTYENIIAVGDYLSHSLLNNNIFPQIMIVDYKTRRDAISTQQKKVLQQSKYTSIKLINPAGVITEELWETMKSLCNSFNPSRFIRVEVEGEEDLAALPAILFAPENVTIIYGMPDKGVVVVESTEKHKEKVRNILAMM